jgi:hypothetical protein
VWEVMAAPRLRQSSQTALDGDRRQMKRWKEGDLKSADKRSGLSE